MCTATSVILKLNEIEEGAHSYHFQLGAPFFSALDEAEISAGEIEVEIDVNTTDRTNFELNVTTRGYAEVACDVCLAPMKQPVEAASRLVAVLGEGESSDDDLVIVPKSSGELNLSWFVYEQVALAIPLRHVHEEGQCAPEMLKALEALKPNHGGDSDATATDPRWDALKNLKTN